MRKLGIQSESPEMQLGARFQAGTDAMMARFNDFNPNQKMDAIFELNKLNDGLAMAVEHKGINQRGWIRTRIFIFTCMLPVACAIGAKQDKSKSDTAWQSARRFKIMVLLIKTCACGPRECKYGSPGCARTVLDFSSPERNFLCEQVGAEKILKASPAMLAEAPKETLLEWGFDLETGLLQKSGQQGFGPNAPQFNSGQN